MYRFAGDADKPVVVELFQQPDHAFGGHAGEFAKVAPGKRQVESVALKNTVRQAQQYVSQPAVQLLAREAVKPSVGLCGTLVQVVDDPVGKPGILPEQLFKHGDINCFHHRFGIATHRVRIGVVAFKYGLQPQQAVGRRNIQDQVF